ncbi:MAG: zinc-dependent metalloprotease [Ekhidna sp.]|uniref:zinc-dependent metalloprotease n=1 Tax=Ekhidna sp. TaxID=2608089 RepID=UPI0032EE5CDD
MKKIAIVLLCMGLVAPIHAQKTKKKKEEDKKEEKSEKTIDEITKSCVAYEGLFKVYQDTANGSVYLEVREDQLNTEYIHFSQIMDAPLDFYERGSYGYEKVFTISKIYERMEITLENITAYFDPNDPLSRAKDANLNRPIIYSEKIEASSKDGKTYLIKAEPLFLKEAFVQITPRPDPRNNDPNALKLGSLSDSKTKFLQIKSFAENTDFRVEMVYENSSAGMFWPVWDDDLTDPRFLSVKVYNTIIKMPENDYRPRFDDPRVGYFGQRVTDMVDRSATPFRDMISRWHLVKKDPNAELSEPVEPIVWWIENTTPEDFREPIKQGILRWNRAFEQAGFKNAMVVKIQPDDAEWDADDIRYNVIRWVSLPRGLYGGAFGPSFFNPRTGQMLGADVIMYYGFIRAQITENDIYSSSSSSAPERFNAKHCAFASELAANFNAGRTMIQALGRGEAEEKELINQSLMMLSLHEVGHTLGLNHNFKASHFLDNEKIHDKEFTSTNGMTGSVMDYSGVNLALDPKKQGLYYEVTPGPYDKWAIEYGYKVFDPKEEEAGLNEILSRSTQPELLFGNDADDMRAPGRGIDPRAQTWDQTSQPIEYAIDRFKLIDQSLKGLMEKVAKENASYQYFNNSYNFLTRDWWVGLTAISRYPGGVYVDRAFIGQEGATKPFTPVPYALQKRAMKAINTYGFSPNAMKTPSEVYNYLQNQRRGFDFWGQTEDPKIHDRILAFQQNILNHMMHARTWQRIIDTEMYGNTYKLSEYATDMTDGIFSEDISGSVNYRRQNLQTEYVNRLVGILMGDEYNHVSKAESFRQLKSIDKMLAKAKSPDSTTAGHREYLAYLIEQAMDED